MLKYKVERNDELVALARANGVTKLCVLCKWSKPIEFFSKTPGWDCYRRPLIIDPINGFPTYPSMLYEREVPIGLHGSSGEFERSIDEPGRMKCGMEGRFFEPLSQEENTDE